MFSSLCLLVDLFQIGVGDDDVFVVVQIEWNSLFSTELNSRSLKLIAVPLFQEFIGILTQKLKILFFPESFSQFLSLGIKEIGIHLTRDMPFDLVRVAEVSPLIKKVNGDYVVQSVVGKMELFLIFIDLLLEFL